jgi:Flp pilus assembly protein TadG
MIYRFNKIRQRRAAALVEFLVVVPMFFIIMISIFEYARLLFTMQMLNNAAREGARFAVVNVTTATTANVQTYVDGYMAGQGASQLVSYSPGSNIAVYMADPTTGGNTGLAWTNAVWGNGIGVSVSGSYQPLMPGLDHLVGPIAIKGVCVMPCEAN